MSVYTPVSEGQLAGWLKGYSVGALRALEPIESGIENTNYFVTTGQGRYVLTLFERLPAAEIPFYLDLMAHLARHGVPCPAPVANNADRILSDGATLLERAAWYATEVYVGTSTSSTPSRAGSRRCASRPTSSTGSSHRCARGCTGR